MKLSSMNEENIRLKVRNNFYLPLTKKIRNKKLVVRNFTIISNNCWGGTIYESYGIIKQSPTVGMFIMPDDYIKFISYLRYYLQQPLHFIRPDESKWKDVLGNKDNWGQYLIGKLGDIELQMLHYHDEVLAKSKWESRIKRVNWNKLIIKFNDQNGATQEHINLFIQIPEKNKLCFVSQLDFKVTDDVIVIKQSSKYTEGVKASREPFGHSKYIDITKYINELGD